MSDFITLMQVDDVRMPLRMNGTMPEAMFSRAPVDEDFFRTAFPAPPQTLSSASPLQALCLRVMRIEFGLLQSLIASAVQAARRCSAPAAQGKRAAAPGACAQPRSAPSSPSAPSVRGGNPIPSGVRYRDEIYKAASDHGLDPLLLAAVASQETGGPGSDSGANVIGADGTGHGVFQIDSGSWQPWLSAHHEGMDVAENAEKAAAILGENLKATGGDVKAALHLYNAGSAERPSTTTTWPGGETLSYEDSVLRHFSALGRESGSAQQVALNNTR